MTAKDSVKGCSQETPSGRLIGYPLVKGNPPICAAHSSQPDVTPDPACRSWCLLRGLGASVQSMAHRHCWIAKDRNAANQMVGFILCDDPAMAAQHQPQEDQADPEASIFSAVVALLEELRRPVQPLLEREAGSIFHIAAVGVAPGYEGNGIARSLLQVALTSADAQGFQDALSECTSKASRRLHEVCGFEQIHCVNLSAFEQHGQHPFAGCDQDVFLMRKRLR